VASIAACTGHGGPMLLSPRRLA